MKRLRKSICLILALVMISSLLVITPITASAVDVGATWRFNYRADTNSDTNLAGYINVTGSVVTSGQGGLNPASQSGTTSDGLPWSVQAVPGTTPNSRNRTGNTAPSADFTHTGAGGATETVSRHIGRSWITNARLTLAVPNGVYNVSVVIGDLGGSFQGGININGTDYAATSPGSSNVALRSFNNIAVNSGELVIYPNNNNGQVCGIIITLVELSGSSEILPNVINLTPDSATILVGDAVSLNAEVLPASANDKSLVWTTSNAAVATVSSSGLVTAVAEGSATITATSVAAPGVSATASITVGATSGGWDDELLELPIAYYNVYGRNMDRGVLAAVAANGVFISWRFFPEEATGVASNATGAKRLAGNTFALYKNGVKLADVTNSTNYLDTTNGTVFDEYVIVTVNPAGDYISRTAVFNPAPRLTTGITGNGANNAGVLTIPVQRPATGRVPNNLTGGTTNASAYNMDQIAVNYAPDGSPIFMVKWESGSPDVISQGFQAPVIWDAYTLEGKLLWRLDLGVNFRAGQHYGIAMTGNFDGTENFQVMLKTAPGSRVMEVVDGVLTGNFSYIGQDFMGENPLKLTRVTRWDGTRNWQPTDDYRNFDGHTAAGTRLSPRTSVQHMSDFFYYWQTHPEVTSALHGANLELDEYANRKCSKAGCEGHGWWMYPPQVMLGMFPANYPERESGASSAAGKHWNSFQTNAQMTNSPLTYTTQWNQSRWELLKTLPTNPCDFKDVVITREIADALALFWVVTVRDSGGEERDRWRGSGHIMGGAEFYTVVDGMTGVELDTIEYAVPMGTFRADGSYVPDVGLLWNDYTEDRAELYNRVNRFNGGVAFLDGNGKNPSVVEQRGYYSRTTITRYDWDGEKLTSKVFIDSGFEVLPNPFANRYSHNKGTMVAIGNMHGGPGRMEKVFNPASPRDELIPSNLSGPERLRWMQLNGSITCQGNHSMTVMDLDGDGKDEALFGSLAVGINDDGEGYVLWTGYEARYQGNTTVKNYNNLQKIGHGDSGFLAYFHPLQQYPGWWTCLEGAWWDGALLNARTGEVVYTDGSGSGTSSTAWGSGGRDVGRAAAGKFYNQPGWQLSTNQGYFNSPLGTSASRAQGGMRLWDGSAPPVSGLSAAGNAFQINWAPDLYTQSTNASISAARTGVGTAMSTTGNRVCGGSKDRPGFVGNILGDYREQLVLGASDASSIRVYFNTQISTNKLATQISDRRYSVELERQKSCYGQPIHASYYYGADMDMRVYYATIAGVDWHTVTFDSAGGSAVDLDIIFNNNTVAEPTEPTRVGYIFKGWFLGDEEYDFTTPVTASITLTAQWEIITFRVDFINEDEPLGFEIVDYGTRVTQPEALTKQGYRFIGWLLDGNVYNFASLVYSDMTLIAGWEEIRLEALGIGYDSATALPAMITAVRNAPPIQFAAVLTPAGANVSLEWSVNNPALATVNKDSGEVTVRGTAGNVILTVKDLNSGISASIVIRIM